MHADVTNLSSSQTQFNDEGLTSFIGVFANTWEVN